MYQFDVFRISDKQTTFLLKSLLVLCIELQLDKTPTGQKPDWTKPRLDKSPPAHCCIGRVWKLDE